MKYIVLQTRDGKELPIIFPETLVHSDVAGVLRARYNCSLVSAGFISSYRIINCEAKCYGESTSLKLKSRGKVDDKLLSFNDYFHGEKHIK